jgi:hypothetical protein
MVSRPFPTSLHSIPKTDPAYAKDREINTDIGSKEYFDLHDAARAASSDAGLSRCQECDRMEVWLLPLLAPNGHAEPVS